LDIIIDLDVDRHPIFAWFPIFIPVLVVDSRILSRDSNYPIFWYQSCSPSISTISTLVVWFRITKRTYDQWLVHGEFSHSKALTRTYAGVLTSRDVLIHYWFCQLTFSYSWLSAIIAKLPWLSVYCSSWFHILILVNAIIDSLNYGKDRSQL
jgi:hypothetical protein